MLIHSIPEADLPLMSGNRLYLDYIAGESRALQFYTHGPTDFAAALAACRGFSYPRVEVAELLRHYNRTLGAGPAALENIAALGEADTFCVIGGQQAGFLGGPIYTAYKIIAIIRLARRLQQEFGLRFVPVFWLATEDHDFHEINHTYYLKGDGEVGRVSFNWDGQGRPVSALPLTAEVTEAYRAYFRRLIPGPHFAEAEGLMAPLPNEDYCTWQARVWSHLFAEWGLILVEPRVLRPAAGGFFQAALESADDIHHHLEQMATRLAAAGYAPQLTSAQAGELYTFDAAGRRIRVEDPRAHLPLAQDQSHHYSTDAALRPLLADALLPVAVDVLGAGEIAYQGMLGPLHHHFGVPQPVLFPRPHYTIVSSEESAALDRYNTSAQEMLTGGFSVDQVFRQGTANPDADAFDRAREGIQAALAPLRPQVEAVDPSLGRTWKGTRTNVLRRLNKLEEKATRARLSQVGRTKKELQGLHSAILPRGRLQERVFPLPHFLNRHGSRFLEAVFQAGDLLDFSHHIITLEDVDARS